MHLQAVALLAAFSLALVNADDKCEGELTLEIYTPVH